MSLVGYWCQFAQKPTLPPLPGPCWPKQQIAGRKTYVEMSSATEAGEISADVAKQIFESCLASVIMVQSLHRLVDLKQIPFHATDLCSFHL